MALKVIGAGFGRTGTLSLKAALEALGFSKCYHMTELIDHPEHIDVWEAASQGKPVDWDALFAGYQATVDFPGYRLYRPLMQHYPDAKVLLSIRDPQQWYDSAFNTIYQAGPSLPQKVLMSLQLPFSPRLRRLIRVFRLPDKLVWKGDFAGKFADKQFAVQVFNQHIADVQQAVAPERLLVYNVAEGWQPLCQFLGVPVPTDLPFPRLNERATWGSGHGTPSTKS